MKNNLPIETGPKDKLRRPFRNSCSSANVLKTEMRPELTKYKNSLHIYLLNCIYYLLNAVVSLDIRRCPVVIVFAAFNKRDVGGDVGDCTVGVDCGKLVVVVVVAAAVVVVVADSVKLVQNVASNRFVAAFDLVGVLCTTTVFDFTAYGDTGVVVCEILLDLSPASPLGSLVCNT